MLRRKHVATTTDEGALPTEGSSGGRSWTERAAAERAWERLHEAEWVRIDQKLRAIAARRAALDAEEANLLRYAEESKLWRGWGCGSMLEYMERVMGYAPHTACERLRVARALAALPLLAEALERGQLAHSAVRELSRVAVAETEATWLEVAQGKALREIEAMVSGRRPGDLPDDPTEPRLHRKTITLELSPETYDIWRKLHALAAEEHGQRLSDDELIQALFRRAYGQGRACPHGCACADEAVGNRASAGASHAGVAGVAATTAMAAAYSPAVATTAAANSTPGTSRATTADESTAIATLVPGAPSASTARGSRVAAGCPSGVTLGAGTLGAPAYKIALKQCPDCGRAWQYTGGRDIEVDPAVLELAACDAVHLGSLDAAVPERATTTVTPRKREQVLARDGHCCTVPGCRRNVGLDLHHIQYQSHGGRHALVNLTTLCDLHHRAVHFEKLVIRGTAPERLTFELREPRDRRNITDDDAPWVGAASPGADEALSMADSPEGAGVTSGEARPTGKRGSERG